MITFNNASRTTIDETLIAKVWMRSREDGSHELCYKLRGFTDDFSMLYRGDTSKERCAKDLDQVLTILQSTRLT